MPGLICCEGLDEVFGVVVAPGGGVVVLLLGLVDPAADEFAMRCASCRCSLILLLALCTAALKSGSFALAARSCNSFRSFWWSFTISPMYFLSKSALEARSISAICALSLR